MNKYLIKVDPKTIRKNPHGGESLAYVAGKTKYELSRVTPLGGKRYRVEHFIGSGFDGHFQLTDPVRISTEERAFDHRPVGMVRITQEHCPIPLFHPQANYYYGYLPTKVACWSCNAQFDHTELQEDYHYYEYGKCETICPSCGRWACCEIEYEKPTDEELAKRMTQGINQVAIE